MESAIRGLVLDSSVLVAAERAKLTTPEVLRNIRASAGVGDAPIIISVMTVAELAHGIYGTNSPERRKLFYRNVTRMMLAGIVTQPTFKASKPRVLFEGRYENL